MANFFGSFFGSSGVDASWVTDAVRTFFAMIDSSVYSIIATVYRILLHLAEYQLFDNATLYEFSRKVYSLLGLFMLFKVSFSFINYIVNPDAFLEKKKGVSKMIQNIVVSLIMLVAAPYCFYGLRYIQNAILSEQMIPKFILGTSGTNADAIIDVSANEFWISDTCQRLVANDNTDDNDTTQTSAPARARSQEDLIALWMFRPFYQPYDPMTDEIDANIVVPDFYCASYSRARVSTYLTSDIYNATNEVKTSGDTKELYMIDYKVLFSTVVGIFGLLILISFSFDVAVRTIKLGFLQLIAPIPIISYIDPKSGENGMFKKWLQQVGQTWASVFVRLVAFYFAIYMIALISRNDFGQFEEDKNWVVLFLILGALIFAKQLPALLQELIPGMKLSGSMNLNPFKRVRDEALGGKALVNGAAALTAGAVGAAGALGGHMWYLNSKRMERKKKFDEYESNIENNRLKQAQERQLALNASRARSQNQQMANRYQAMANKDGIPGGTKLKYEQLQKHFESQAAKAAQMSAEHSAKASEAGQNIRSNEEAIAKLKKDKSRLYRHPIVSSLGTAAKGAYFGMKGGYGAGSNLKKVPGAGVQAIQSASKERNDREKRGVGTDIADKLTDVFGVKNPSGTTSLANKEIKRLNDSLNRFQAEQQRMTYQISNLGQQFADRQDEYNRVVRLTEENGKRMLQYGNDLSTAFQNYTSSGGNVFNEREFNSIYSNVIEQANIEQRIADINREIKEQQEVMRKSDKK